ncbi:hypothetical protein [Geobacillus sp. C56-T2]|uniref:hypothetical protein n=1 Tax=Geobacillus sp. C56-T2 TaxID=600773 RepID=UPI0011A00350|nr:hypothetical protein [Geobacillus sp. C56-T2]NNV06006.1 hypothetical protein [Geobacillus sp. MMMUD3]
MFVPIMFSACVCLLLRHPGALAHPGGDHVFRLRPSAFELDGKTLAPTAYGCFSLPFSPRFYMMIDGSMTSGGWT